MNMTSDVVAVSTSASSSAITLSWSPLNSSTITGYQVTCNSDDILTSNDTNQRYSQISNHSISVLINSTFTNNVEVHNLVPGLSYNCCVSTLDETYDTTLLYCEGSLRLASVLSLPVVGAIGAAAGAAAL